MRAFLVEETEEGFQGEWSEVENKALASGEVRIAVEYSSLNYKDALSYSGNKGVTRSYPHVPGIDAAGKIVESNSDHFQVGDQVMVTGYDLGMNTNGGFAEMVTVPDSWVVSRPDTLTSLQAMALGTAGLTAGLCVEKLLRNGVLPDQGAVLISGASGGVGSIACKLLKKLGFSLVAVERSKEKRAFLEQLGVDSFISASDLIEDSKKPLLKPAFAAAIDVAGGDTLAGILKQIKPGGSVAACGLVDNPKLQTSVFPFILRGINLLGVDSVEIDLSQKQLIWNNFAEKWSVDVEFELIERPVLAQYLEALLEGKAKGRYVLKVA